MAWLYMPPAAMEMAQASMESPCAPAPADSSSVSTSPWETTELFVMSSGTLTPRRLSWPGWKTRPWIRRLSGTISEPSLAVHGAASWISSLRDTRASHSVRRGGVAENQTQGIYGRTSAASSFKPAPRSSSSKTSKATFLSDIVTSDEIWRLSVIALRADSLRRRRSGRVNSATDCSFWPAMTASEGAKAPAYLKNGQPSLTTKARLWPTILARDCGVHGLMKPASQARREARGKHGVPLAEYAAHHFPAADCPSSLRDLVITLDGWSSCVTSRRLSPLFGEALMGWPSGWTDCGSAVTAWSPWLRRMRSAFWRLASACSDGETR